MLQLDPTQVSVFVLLYLLVQKYKYWHVRAQISPTHLCLHLDPTQRIVQQLRSENTLLRAENAQFRLQLGLSLYEKVYYSYVRSILYYSCTSSY